jgi:hypothetical protein
LSDYIQPLLKLETNKSNEVKIFKIAKNNNFAEDNIIRKIKRRFLEKVRLLLNEEYKNYSIAKKR